MRAVLLFLEAFLDSVKSGTSVLNFLPHHSSVLREKRICLLLTLTAWTPHFHSCAIPYPSVSLHPFKQLALVQESLPEDHRLRLSASAWVPTNPERTVSLPQETLRYSVEGILTPSFLLIPAFSLLSAPPVLRSDFTALRTLSYPTEPLKRDHPSFINMFGPRYIFGAGSL